MAKPDPCVAAIPATSAKDLLRDSPPVNRDGTRFFLSDCSDLRDILFTIHNLSANPLYAAHQYDFTISHHEPGFLGKTLCHVPRWVLSDKSQLGEFYYSHLSPIMLPRPLGNWLRRRFLFFGTYTTTFFSIE